MHGDDMMVPPGVLLPTEATEQTLYEAASLITDEYPEFGLAIATFVEEDEQFLVRLGGPTIGTVSAVLACVSALHESMKSDGGSPFVTEPMKMFPSCASQLLKGRSYDDVVDKLLSAESDLLDSVRDDPESVMLLGPTHPPMTGWMGVPRLVEAMTTVLQVGSDMSRMHDPVPFTIAFALSDDGGELWSAYIGGWPVQSAIAVLSMLNSLKEFVERGIRRYPELRGLDKQLLPMVRKAWSTGKIDGLAEQTVQKL